MKRSVWLILLNLALISSVSYAEVEDSKAPKLFQGISQDSDFGDLPTYIKSESLTLLAEKRHFVYSGGVEVKHGDMTLTADSLEGNYTESNEIKDLTAIKNVVITKGENIRANSEKAYYDAISETMMLTENPELQQEGSVLSADKIKIFLEEERSVAEGAVRVKLIKKAAPSKEEKTIN